MPSTYTLITGETISTTTATYTFTAIPSTFTDLVVRISPRTDQSNPDFMWRINGNTSSIYSDTQIEGDGATATSYRDNAIDKFRMQHIGQGSTTTANTFGSYELYFPNYLVSANKVVSFFGVDENNSVSTSVQIVAGASLGLTTTAISEISIFLNSGNWVSGSSFYLYGIKNS